MYRNSTGMTTFDRGDAIYACNCAAVDDHSYGSALYSAATAMTSKVDRDFNYISNMTDRMSDIEDQVATLKAIMSTASLKKHRPAPPAYFSSWLDFEEVYK